MRNNRLLILSLVLALLACPVWADGLLVPMGKDIAIPGATIAHHHYVDIRVSDQAGTVAVDQLFYNALPVPQQVEYWMPVTPGMAVNSLAVNIGGHAADLSSTSAAEAGTFLKDFATRKNDPSVLEFVGDSLQRSAPFVVEANAPVRVLSNYSTSFRKENNILEITYPLGGTKYSIVRVPEVSIMVDVVSHQNIVSVFSPTHQVKWYYKDNDPHRVIITWDGQYIPASDLRILVKTADIFEIDDANRVLNPTFLTYRDDPNRDGYFMLLLDAMPKPAAKVTPKDVVLVLDRSGAMGGNRFEHQRFATEYVLRNLNPDDRFNLVIYDDVSEFVFSDVVPATKTRVQEAMDWLARAQPSEGCNLHRAMEVTMVMLSARQKKDRDEALEKYQVDESCRQKQYVEKLKARHARECHEESFCCCKYCWGNIPVTTQPANKKHNPCPVCCCCCCRCPHPATRPADFTPADRPQYVFLFNNSVPTTGKTTEEKTILTDTRYFNVSGAKIFTFGIGYNVNVRLLDRLASENGGRSFYVSEKNPVVETKVIPLYDSLQYPVFTNPVLEFRGLRVKDAYPRQLDDLTRAGPVMMIGRYDSNIVETSAQPKVMVRGGYDGNQQVYVLPLKPVTEMPADQRDFIARAWTQRRLGYLMDHIQVYFKSKEVSDELIRLSRDYGLITPYTMFLIDPSVSLSDRRELNEDVQWQTEALWHYRGVNGVIGAVNRQAIRRTPVALPSTMPGRDPNEPANSQLVYGYPSKVSYEAQAPDIVAGVRIVDNTAIYQRGSLWIAANAADVDLRVDADKVKTLEPFTAEYFALLNGPNSLETRLLATQRAGEHLVVRLRGQVYHIMPPALPERASVTP